MSEERINLTNQPATQPGEPAYVPPTDVVPLPSKGICYPVDHPLHGVDRVEIRSMTAKEEDILTSTALLKQGKAMSALIRSCLLNKTIDPDDLLTGDRNAILMAIRVTGYGPEYEVKVACPACEEIVDHTFNLQKLSVTNFAEDVSPIEPGTNKFLFKLPVLKKDVIFKLQTGSSQREVDQEQEASKRKLGPAADKPVTTNIFYHTLSLGGETDRGKLRSIVERLPAGDSRALRNYMDKISPGIEMVQEMKCPHCDAVSEVEVPMGTEFFWPQSE